MARSPQESLATRLRASEEARAKVELLVTTGAMTRREAERVYEGLFMRAITTLEAFFEELFFLTVLGESGHPKSRALPRAQFKSRAVLSTFVLQGRDYVDWLPYKAVENRASIYLRKGRPFSELSDGQRSQIKQWHITRNAIAHPGRHAQERFRRTVIGEMTLLPHEKTPSGFLRSMLQPKLRRFESILSDMRQVGVDLS
jgi:hypothetical protein